MEKGSEPMSLHWSGEIRKFEGYFRLGWEKPGMVEFYPDTPQKIQDAFWEMWPRYREMVIQRQKNGIFSSDYPFLPDIDPIENRIHYDESFHQMETGKNDYDPENLK